MAYRYADLHTSASSSKRAGCTAGVHDFEGGYSDERLAQLFESICERALRAYDNVVATSFSEEFRRLLDAPPQVLGVLCFPGVSGAMPTSQWTSNINFGPATAINGGILDGKRAAAVTITQGGVASLEDVPDQPWTSIVNTPNGCFQVSIRRMTGSASILYAYSAPSFVRNGSNSTARFAPVRALVYELLGLAMKDVSAEALLGLVCAR